MKKILKHNLTIDFKQSAELESFNKCEWIVQNIHKKDSENKELFEVYISSGNTTYQVIDIYPTVQVEPYITSFTMAGVASILLYTEQKNPDRKFSHNIPFIKDGKVDLTNYQPEEVSNVKQRFQNVLNALKTRPTFEEFENLNKNKP